MTALLVSAGGKSEQGLINICLPESLRRWKEKHKIEDLPGTKYADQGHKCDLNIKDLKGKAKSGKLKSLKQRIHIWQVFDKLLQADRSLAQFPRVSNNCKKTLSLNTLNLEQETKNYVSEICDRRGKFCKEISFTRRKF